MFNGWKPNVQPGFAPRQSYAVLKTSTAPINQQESDEGKTWTSTIGAPKNQTEKPEEPEQTPKADPSVVPEGDPLDLTSVFASTFFWLELGVLFQTFWWFAMDSDNDDTYMMTMIGLIWGSVFLIYPSILLAQWKRRHDSGASEGSGRASVYSLQIIFIALSFIPHPIARAVFSSLATASFVVTLGGNTHPSALPDGLILALCVTYANREENPLWDAGIFTWIAIVVQLSATTTAGYYHKETTAIQRVEEAELADLELASIVAGNPPSTEDASGAKVVLTLKAKKPQTNKIRTTRRKKDTSEQKEPDTEAPNNDKYGQENDWTWYAVVEVLILTLWLPYLLSGVVMLFGTNAPLTRWSSMNTQETGWIIPAIGLFFMSSRTGIMSMINRTIKKKLHSRLMGVLALSLVFIGITALFRYSGRSARFAFGVLVFLCILMIIPELPKRIRRLPLIGRGIVYTLGLIVLLFCVLTFGAIQYGDLIEGMGMYEAEPMWILVPFVAFTVIGLLAVRQSHYSKPDKVPRVHKRVGTVLVIGLLLLVAGIAFRHHDMNMKHELPQCTEDAGETTNISVKNPADVLRVVTWNLAQGFRNDGRSNTVDVKQLVDELTMGIDEGQTLWALQETNTHHTLAGNSDLLGYVARHQGLHNSQNYKEGTRQPFEDGGGTAMLWSHGFAGNAVTSTLEGDNDDAMTRTWMVIDTTFSCGRLVVINLHLTPEEPATGAAQMAQVTAYVNQLLTADPTLAIVVAGDFNYLSTSPVGTQLTGLGFNAVMEATETYANDLLGGSIDHIFYINLDLIHQSVIQTDASDHYPKWAQFTRMTPQ